MHQEDFFSGKKKSPGITGAWFFKQVLKLRFMESGDKGYQGREFRLW